MKFERIEPATLERTLKGLKEKGELKAVAAIIGRDTGQEVELTYLLRLSDGETRGLRIHLSRQSPRVASIADQWPSLEHHERELAELLGVEFSGMAPGRFLLPEDWVGQPLRKDYVFPENYHGVEHRRAPLRKEHQRP